jgi:hypothetical protein
VREAARQVRSSQGDDALLRAVEIEPWSRLPERRWALVSLKNLSALPGVGQVPDDFSS